MKFLPKNPDIAVTHQANLGPSFGRAISLCKDHEQDMLRGKCFTGPADPAGYDVTIDDQGNNILTNDGARQEGHEKFFTLLDLEVHLLTPLR